VQTFGTQQPYVTASWLPETAANATNKKCSDIVGEVRLRTRFSLAPFERFEHSNVGLCAVVLKAADGSSGSNPVWEVPKPKSRIGAEDPADASPFNKLLLNRDKHAVALLLQVWSSNTLGGDELVGKVIAGVGQRQVPRLTVGTLRCRWRSS
jgi:hypothetical protein